MEININKIMRNPLFDPEFYSNSIAGSGLQNIGQVTWNNARNSTIQLVNDENKESVKDYFMGFGAWEESELESVEDLNAMLIQEISAQLNEVDIYLNDDEESKIKKLESNYESDHISLAIYHGSDNNFYFYAGF